MIKTLLIMILFCALVGAAALTRPSEADFREFRKQVEEKEDKSLIEHLFGSGQSEMVYSNKILWADVKKDGKIVYIGAFSHWFDRSEPLAKPVESRP